jgi:hypothetical protein
MQTVTTLADSGAGSLRAAILAASLGEEVVFTSGLTGTVTITGTALTISQDIIITGPGFSFITVARTSGTGLVFNITSGVNTITGITVSGGIGTNGGNLANAGTTTISNCIFQNGTAQQGGGIFNQSSLTLNNCLIQNNVASGTTNLYGAGIFNTGTLICNFCNITSNTISATGDARGGGCYSNGTATFTSCNINQNSVAGFTPYGGGAHNEGTMTLTQTTVDQNTCTGNVATALAQGGGLSSALGTLTVEFSTVSRNTCTSASGENAGGGGIMSFVGNSTYVNSSTIAANTVVPGSGGAIQGGALYMDNTCAVQVNNSTIWNNTSGVFIISGAAFLPYDSIISGSDPGNFDIDGGGGVGSYFTSQGHNVFGSANISFTAGAGDFTNSNPTLLNMGSLAYNGGVTKTYALLPGSIAIDAGDNTSAPATDQRGGPRIINGTIDIGAFEAIVPPVFCIPADTYCQTLVDPTPEQIAATKAALNAQALAAAEALAGEPTACCIAPAFTTQYHTGTLTGGGVQRFSFTPTATNQSLSFWVWSPDGDIGLKLYDTDGTTELYRDSDPEEDQRGMYVGPTGAQPRSVAGISYTLPTTGTYFIDCNAWGLGGTFNLYISNIDITGVVECNPATLYNYNSAYVSTTRKLFTVAFGRNTSTNDSAVNVFDTYSLSLINNPAVSKGGFSTGVYRTIFYNPFDDSVWCIARNDGTTVYHFVRLHSATGVVLESFTPPSAIPSADDITGFYVPSNNHLYMAYRMGGGSGVNAISIFDCGSRTYLTPISIVGATTNNTAISYSYDSANNKLYVFYTDFSGTNLLVTINTTTDIGVTTTLSRDFLLTSAQLPFQNGVVWGASTGATRLCTYDPSIDTFNDLRWLASNGPITAIAYDPCRNCMVTAGSANVLFENLPFPFFPWGVGYYSRIDLSGQWLESGIVDMIRTASHSADPPIWAHPVWNPETSRMSYVSSGTVFQI